MKVELVIRADAGAGVAEARLLDEAGVLGYVGGPAGPGRIVLHRGSRWRRPFSPRIEDWPTTLTATVLTVDGGATGIILRYEIRTGWHLVGAVDRAVIEAEAVLFEEALGGGPCRRLREVVGALRRPVLVAAALNMVLAAAVVAFVGLLGGYRPWVVALVAFAVAFLDGLVIMAFADLVLEGARSVPRLSERRPATSAPAPSSGA